MNKQSITQRSLHELVTQRVDVKWSDFAAAHPHLARAIERTTIIDAAVERLADDPAVRAALDQAARDEATLVASEQLLASIDAWVGRLLAL